MHTKICQECKGTGGRATCHACGGAGTLWLCASCGGGGRAQGALECQDCQGVSTFAWGNLPSYMRKNVLAVPCAMCLGTRCAFCLGGGVLLDSGEPLPRLKNQLPLPF